MISERNILSEATDYDKDIKDLLEMDELVTRDFQSNFFVWSKERNTYGGDLMQEHRGLWIRERSAILSRNSSINIFFLNNRGKWLMGQVV